MMRHMRMRIAAIGVALVVSAFAAPQVSAEVAAGTLIRGSLPTVYYVGTDGRRHPFPNARVYATWYSDFSSVRRISDAELGTIPLGGNVTVRPGERMVKVESDPKTYAVSRGSVLRWVTGEAVARTLYGTDWYLKIEEVSSALFGNYTVGEPITEVAAYSPASERDAVRTIAENVVTAAPALSPSPTPAGCAYQNPSCPSGQVCSGNTCIVPTCTTDADCSPETPGLYECRGFTSCIRRTFSCNGACGSGETCVKDRCIPLDQVSYVDDRQSYPCAAADVFVDGACRPATYVLVVAQNPDVDTALFDRRAKESMAVLLETTPLGGCDRRRIKVYLQHGFCCSDLHTKNCMERVHAGYDAAVLFNNGDFGSCVASSGSGDRLAFVNQDAIAAVPHEFGHIYGLWEGYCYLPHASNPNPVDFDTGRCRPAGADLAAVCGRMPTGDSVTPYECTGMPNGYGWPTIMGRLNVEPGAPGFGFTDVEYQHLGRNVACRA